MERDIPFALAHPEYVNSAEIAVYPQTIVHPGEIGGITADVYTMKYEYRDEPRESLASFQFGNLLRIYDPTEVTPTTDCAIDIKAVGIQNVFYHGYPYIYHTLASLATLLAVPDRFQDATVVDFGSGAIGLLGVVAYALGARKVMLYEKEDDGKTFDLFRRVNDIPSEPFVFIQDDILNYAAHRRALRDVTVAIENIGAGWWDYISTSDIDIATWDAATLSPHLQTFIGSDYRYYPKQPLSEDPWFMTRSPLTTALKISDRITRQGFSLVDGVDIRTPDHNALTFVAERV